MKDPAAVGTAHGRRALVDRPGFWIGLMAAGWSAAILVAVSPQIWRSPFLIVQNDGRHFVAWLRAMADPALFAGDPIAAYFDALTPAFYKALFVPAMWLGVDAVAWHLLVVAPLACLLFTLAALRLSMHLFASTRLAGFAALALTAVLADQPVVGLPRSFALVIVFVALAAILEGRRVVLCAVLFIGANLYPAAAITAGAAFGVHVLMPVRPYRFAVPKTLGWLAAAGLSTLAGLALFLWQSADTGATVTLAEAARHPIFAEGARTAFFRDSRAAQLVCEGRGGLLSMDCIGGTGWPAAALTLAAAVALAVAGLLAHRWLAARDCHRPHRLAAGGSRRSREPLYRLLAALVLAGLTLFAASYAVAFRAHLPARYGTLSVGVVETLATAAIAVALLEAAGRALFAGQARRRDAAAALTAVVAAILVFNAAKNDVNLIVDKEPAISAHLRGAPADSLVAGFSRAIDNVPAFSARPVYVSLELLIPYKSDHLRRMEGRVARLARVYAPDGAEAMARFVEETGVTHVLVARDPGMEIGPWLSTYAALAPLAQANLFTQRGAALAPCVLVAGRAHDLFDAACLARRLVSRAG